VGTHVIRSVGGGVADHRTAGREGDGRVDSGSTAVHWPLGHHRPAPVSLVPSLSVIFWVALRVAKHYREAALTRAVFAAHRLLAQDGKVTEFACGLPGAADTTTRPPRGREGGETRR
jgi:hypothetical protein